jgi:hypothetical protein
LLIRRSDGSRDADTLLDTLWELAFSLPINKGQQLKEGIQAGAITQLMGARSRRWGAKKKNGEISCIERVPARDGWTAAGIKMLLMHLDGSPLSVLFWGRLFT